MISTVVREKILLQEWFELIYVCKELIHSQDAQKYAQESLSFVEHLVSLCSLLKI